MNITWGEGEIFRNFIHENTLWIYLIVATSLVVVLAAVFSLSHGINDIFPYFFLAPVLLVAYAFPHRGVMVTIALGWIYIVLVYVFGTLSARILAVHTAWFFIFVSVGIAISHFAQSSRARKNEVEQLKREAFRQIEHNMVQFTILNDQIRNPLQAIMLDTAALDETTKALISVQVQIIEKILDRLDEGFLESEKVRKFFTEILWSGEKLDVFLIFSFLWPGRQDTGRKSVDAGH